MTVNINDLDFKNISLDEKSYEKFMILHTKLFMVQKPYILFLIE